MIYYKLTFNLLTLVFAKRSLAADILFLQLRVNLILGGETMFFKSRKKKLAEEAARKQAEDLKRAREEKRKQDEEIAYLHNQNAFYNICHMVKSLPKRRQVVVIQRYYNFYNDSHRSRCYMELVNRLKYEHRRNGTNYMFYHDGALIAFYAPTRLTLEFERALRNFSKDGCKFVHIRYYS